MAQGSLPDTALVKDALGKVTKVLEEKLKYKEGGQSSAFFYLRSVFQDQPTITIQSYRFAIQLTSLRELENTLRAFRLKFLFSIIKIEKHKNLLVIKGTCKAEYIFGKIFQQL